MASAQCTGVTLRSRLWLRSDHRKQYHWDGKSSCLEQLYKIRISHGLVQKTKENNHNNARNSTCGGALVLGCNWRQRERQFHEELYSQWRGNKVEKRSRRYLVFRHKRSRKLFCSSICQQRQKNWQHVFAKASGGTEIDGTKTNVVEKEQNVGMALDGECRSKNLVCLDIRHQRARRLNYQHRLLWVDSRPSTVDAAIENNLGGWKASSLVMYRPNCELQSLCEEGQLEKALNLLLRMDLLGTVPSVIVYRSLLTACAKQKSLAKAKRVLAHMVKHGMESTRSLGESVVSTLVKCGGLEDALQVFCRLSHQTVFSFTAVISGYTRAGRAQEALTMYHCMREKGLDPNKYTFASIFKACGYMCNLEQGRKIHEEALKYNCASDLFVGTCLLDMYAKCGSIVDAKNVFDGLPQRDVVSWTAMLVAYAQQGQAEEALQHFEEMLKEGVSPNDRTFASALQACATLAEGEADAFVDGTLTKMKSLEKGEAIHFEARRRGYESDLFVGSSLVTMYSKCGRIRDAQCVFDGLPERDVVSWNAMLAAYGQQGQPEKALQLYEQMLEEGLIPDVRTFVSALQACGMLAEKEDDTFVDGESNKLKYMEKGKAIYAGAQRRGYESDIFISNTLVSMYGKCGSFVNAQNVFNRLCVRDLVSWNTMLAAYAQQGQPENALQIYEQMLEEGVSPDIRTFVSSFQACGMLAEKEEDVVADGLSIKVESLEKAKKIHAEAWRRGYDSDIFIGNTLVSMYGKCGGVVDAHNAFKGLSHQDVVSWTAMLAAYAQQGQAENALRLYQQMLEEGVNPDNRAFAITLQACGILADKEEYLVVVKQFAKAESLKMGKAIHAEAWKTGYRLDVFVSSALITMHGKCGSVLSARHVFDGLFQKGVVIWNAMLAAYILHGQGEKASQLFIQMMEEGVSPDVRTFVCMLQACGILSDQEDGDVLDDRWMKVRSLDVGKVIHAEAWKRGYKPDVFLASALVSMYGKCGSIMDAQTVFEELPERDVVAWNAMLAAYAQLGQGEDALHLYRRMKEHGFGPDEMTLVSVLQACSDLGSLDACIQIHENLVSGGNSLTPLLASSLIHAYGRCASMVEAQNVFDTLPDPSVVSWTALIAGYARQGNVETSLQCYDEMLLAGVKPNGVTFLSILSACSHAGLVNKGVECFESMSRDHGMSPEIEHYVSMVDLLGRAGHFKRLQDLLSKMSMQPDLSIWLSLLGACRKHGKLVLGKQAFDCAVSLNPKHPAAYAMMTNIYAHAGLWDHAHQVNELRQTAGACSRPGQSWIGHEQNVHSFEVADHKQREQLYPLLGAVGLGLKQEGLDFSLPSVCPKNQETLLRGISTELTLAFRALHISDGKPMEMVKDHNNVPTAISQLLPHTQTGVNHVNHGRSEMFW